MNFISPTLFLSAFNCPHCRAFAHQEWFIGAASPIIGGSRSAISAFGNSLPVPTISKEGQQQSGTLIHNLCFSRCANCKKLAIWVGREIVFPSSGEAPQANPDMPDDIQRDYKEASEILNISPRGAAALVRLAIEKLCRQLGDPNKSINDNIKKMVEDGLDQRTQRALDAVRIIGNHAVHPGQIDLTDDRAMAESLFKLLNLIVEKMISEPRHIDDIYSGLPKGALDAIDKRDGKS